MSRARAEIAEQPAVVGALLEREREPIERLAAEVRRRRPRYAVVAARGSSDNAARYAQHALGRSPATGSPCRPAPRSRACADA